ncbi:hypothetical protein BpHYR1_035479 [Brachionus plicatilis]|uniref:Uncharacterized protein n=1 Tax=Brachionus plicatilis TaxID=10195 RepID=A0A3M7RRB1_BRAPC|nr:hypothetical protein BpHYR1_035479 [Brachionus plicatilis]
MLRLGNGHLSCLDYIRHKSRQLMRMKLRKDQEFQIGRLSLSLMITEKSNSLIILSNIMPFSFYRTQPICFVLALRSPLDSRVLVSFVMN